MSRVTPILCVVSILVSAPPSMAQAPAAAEASPREEEPYGNSKRLPSWLRLGVELRGRAEFNLDPYQDCDDRLYLSRIRLNAAVQAARWMRFFFEGQDARVFHLNLGPAFAGRANTFDVRQSYFSLGYAEQGFEVRLGRQEISVGDERLVGADNYWDAFGQVFDAVRVSFARQQLRLDAFTGFRVEPAHRRPDLPDKANRISGLSAQWMHTKNEGVLQPYLLWKRGGDTFDLMGNPGHRDVVTPGLRAQGNLPLRLDYNLEMALQRGHVAGDRISAWAGHLETGWKPLGRELGPRLGFEYSFASGDTDPEDGRHSAFDDLYPAGFNKFGITDPFAWRNIRYPAVGADVPLTRSWTVYGGWRSLALATVKDGLYPGGDEYLVRNSEASSSHIGNQVFLSGGYERSERWRVYAGYAHLFPGRYLHQSGFPSALRTVYLMSSFVF